MLFEIYNGFQLTDCFCNAQSMRILISDRLSILRSFISENSLCFQHPYFKMQSSRKEKANKYLGLKAKEKIKTVGLSHQLCSHRVHAHMQAVHMSSGWNVLIRASLLGFPYSRLFKFCCFPSMPLPNTHIHTATNLSFPPLHGLLKYEMLYLKL